MGKISTISNELKEWIQNTLNNGVSPEFIVDAMVKKGFAEKYAYTTLFRMIRNQPIQTIDEHAPYVVELPHIANKGNLISTTDKLDIKVTLRMEKPFILYLDNLLSSHECEKLISLAKDRLRRSQVIDAETGKEKTVPGRTSEGTEFAVMENRLITTIEKRIAALTDFPIINGESLQVLHYNQGEEYKSHYDYFPDSKVDAAKGGQRIATLLMYLNDVEAGGETVFPKLGLSLSPKKGAAVYFHYGNSKGQTDRLSLHSSTPVINGDKWVATKWIRQGKIYD
ncbi:2OG-Fe(II) oxygenase [Bacillus tuaregi]|uniref:2OG-Fe(II) oxygenase n=1 Tax=Bacillus tuaregi TaxID=1816695 RepID=UPI0008F8ADC7|nr:2OG-Fe(II) oxygenase [Bacillus tuaregi]